MKAFVLIVCINPNFLGCDVIIEDYFNTRQECNEAIDKLKIRENDAAACKSTDIIKK